MGGDAKWKRRQALGLNGGMGKNRNLGEKIKVPKSEEETGSDESLD
jgi:hypothetical protein